jgi:hypothetical protein
VGEVLDVVLVLVVIAVDTVVLVVVGVVVIVVVVVGMVAHAPLFVQSPETPPGTSSSDHQFAVQRSPPYVTSSPPT